MPMLDPIIKMSLREAYYADKEVIAKEDAKITKGKIKDLDIPKGLTLGGLVRDGVGQIINGDTEIKANDRVLIICVNDILHKIEKLFG